VHRLRPALAAAAALTLTAAAAPAIGATTTTPATGVAQSTLTLLDVALAGHSVQAGQIAAVASDTTSRVAQIVVTPAVLDGNAVGRQTVTPSSAPATVPAGSPQTVSVPNLLSLTGPTLSVDAQVGPAAVLTSAALKALGQLTLTPAGLTSLPVNLQAASLDNLAKVTDAQTEASKSIVIGGLSLPSINDLLKSLGVDLNALLDQLTQGNLNTLESLVGANLTTLNAAVDSAQAALTAAGQSAPDTLAAAQAALAPAQAAVTSAQTALTAAQTALDAANSAWNTAFAAINPALLPSGVSSSLTPAGFQALAPAVQTTVDALTSADLAGLAATAVNAQTAFDAANAVLAAANSVVTLVNNLIDALQALVNAVLNAVTTNTDPLAALGNITIQTRAVTTNTSTPTPIAEAKVGTLKILGTDAVPSQLTSALGAATKTLSDVLRSVAGVAFTPPSIAIGTGTTSTSKVGDTRKATASITGLTVTLPAIALPTALSTIVTAVPGAATIAGNVVSVLGGSVKVGTLAESAAHTPASSTTSTPSTPSTPTGSKTPSGPSLASTGLSRTIPALAALFVLGALAVFHRRRVAHER
jgi:hypothetical protein